MHTLIAVGTGVAWIYSTIAMLFPRIFPSEEFTDVYYDVTVVVTALVVLGLAMEIKAKGRTSEAIKKLIGLQAKTARIVRDGKEVDIPVEEVLLTDLGLGERLHFLPEKLSGGEKQRVAIARALVNDPTLILADEPTANLDSKIGHEIMRLLRRIAKEQGRSVVIVSHDQRIKDIADRVLWLEDSEFKEMVTMATDPVCGMAVEREKAAATLEWAGTTYYFCLKGCRAEFESNQRESIEFNRLAYSS
jgi:ABC-type thiamine transport system ATPase subunit